jgi:Ca2+-binding RTX toxin-like protein
MAGGAGNDTYVVSNGTDVVTELAGQGVDLVVSITGSFTLGDNLENLTLDNIAIVYASGTGNGLNNVIIGDSGFDTLNGLDGSDTLLGNWGDDNLMGGNGLDSLDGGNGEDTLNGGLGNDVLTGGADDDHFTFNTALSSTNVDTITDFGDGTDIIWLDDSIFSTWGNYYSETPLDGSAFYEADGATTAQDAYDRIIYDTSTGALYYDHDGVGGDASIQFATLSNQYAFLSAFNFHIYP